MIPAAFRAGTLGRRLLVGALIWVLATLLATGALLTDLFRSHVVRQTQKELSFHLNQLNGHLDLDEQGVPQMPRQLSDPRFTTPYAGLYWQVDDAAGKPLLRSRSLWESVLSPDPADADEKGKILHEAGLQGPEPRAVLTLTRRVVPEDAPDRPLLLRVAMDADSARQPVRDFIVILAISIGLLVLGLVAAVVWQLRQALTPLDRLRRALADVRAGGAPRLQGDYPAEIQPLVEEFNAVLAHDAERVERSRVQAGNLAHAVKTPLTILANAAEGETGELAKLVAEQVQTARRQVDYHLARARATARPALEHSPLAVRPLLEGLLRVMEKLHGERGLRLTLTPTTDEATFRGAAQDFQEMVGNLLDNACKWAKSAVTVGAAATADGRVEIVIADDGPGLPAEIRQRALQRGVRADEAMPGSGLGLAIVADLVENHGGAIYLEESESGGLKARLLLPAQ